MIIINIYEADEFKKMLSVALKLNNKKIFKCSFNLNKQRMKWEFSNYTFKFNTSIFEYPKFIYDYYTFDIMMFQDLIQPLSEFSLKIDLDLNKIIINEIEISLFKLDINDEPPMELKYENKAIIDSKLFSKINCEYSPYLYLIHTKLYLILLFKYGTEFINRSTRISNDKFNKNFKTIINSDIVSMLQNLNNNKLKIYTDNINGIKFKYITNDFNFQLFLNN